MLLTERYGGMDPYSTPTRSPLHSDHSMETQQCYCSVAMLLFSGNEDMFFCRFPQAHPHMLVLKSLAFENRLVLSIRLRTREQAQNETTMNILALRKMKHPFRPRPGYSPRCLEVMLVYFSSRTVATGVYS